MVNVSGSEGIDQACGKNGETNTVNSLKEAMKIVLFGTKRTRKKCPFGLLSKLGTLEQCPNITVCSKINIASASVQDWESKIKLKPMCYEPGSWK
jgi:hypothetical protein